MDSRVVMGGLHYSRTKNVPTEVTGFRRYGKDCSIVFVDYITIEDTENYEAGAS